MQPVSIATLLKLFGASISTADLNQPTSYPVCKLLAGKAVNERLVAGNERNGPLLPVSADERGQHE